MAVLAKAISVIVRCDTATLHSTEEAAELADVELEQSRARVQRMLEHKAQEEGE